AGPRAGPDPGRPPRTPRLPGRQPDRHHDPRAGPRDEASSAGFDRVVTRRRAALVTRPEPLGIAPDHAAALAALPISALHGAPAPSRTARSTEPLTTTEALISAIDHHPAAQPATP